MYRDDKTHCEETKRLFASFAVQVIFNFEFNLEFFKLKKISVTYVNITKSLLKREKK